MSAVRRSGRSLQAPGERLIGALIPDVRAAKAVAPAPLPVLPTPAPPVGTEDLLLAVARVDRSGRISARALLVALGWGPKQVLAMDAVRGAVVIGLAGAGANHPAGGAGSAAVDTRGQLSLPLAVRALCGIDTGDTVVLEEINLVARTTGNDTVLDALLLRLHTETACRRGGALGLRVMDLNTVQGMVRLNEKGGTLRWQPITLDLAARLAEHAAGRGQGSGVFPACLVCR